MGFSSLDIAKGSQQGLSLHLNYHSMGSVQQQSGRFRGDEAAIPGESTAASLLSSAEQLSPLTLST